MHLCMYVCINYKCHHHTYTHARHTYTHAHAHAHAHAHTHKNTHAPTHKHTQARTHTRTRTRAPGVPLEDLLERVRQRLPWATKLIIAQNDSREEMVLALQMVLPRK